MMKEATILLTILTLGACQGNIGEKCTSTNNKEGVCQLLKDCPAASDEVKKKVLPHICGFKNQEPLICCEQGSQERKPGDISQAKCKEYSKYVYTKIVSSKTHDETLEDGCSSKSVPLNEGYIPNIKEYPHMVAIGYQTENDDIAWHCSGSLISENFVLTAAHCLTMKDGIAKYVKLGATDILSPGEQSQQFIIKKSIPHPEYKYDNNSLYNDIGLIELDKPANLNSYVRPACLHYGEITNTIKAISTGFDRSENGETESITLNHVSYILMANSTCNNNSFKSDTSQEPPKAIVQDTKICVGFPNLLDKDRYDMSDSGGPLQIADTQIYCMFDIVGVSSFTKDNNKEPRIYTRVAHYIEWIENTVWLSLDS